jgi:hypothetical protein
MPSQQISRLAGGGSTLVNGGAANFEDINPNAIAVDSFGDLYVNDAYNHLVSEIGPNGDLVFPSTPVNSTSAPLTVTLSNTGNAPLSFANPNEDGVAPANRRHGISAVKGSKRCATAPTWWTLAATAASAGPFAIATGGTCNFDDGIRCGRKLHHERDLHPDGYWAGDRVHFPLHQLGHRRVKLQ